MAPRDGEDYQPQGGGTPSCGRDEDTGPSPSDATFWPADTPTYLVHPFGPWTETDPSRQMGVASGMTLASHPGHPIMRREMVQAPQGQAPAPGKSTRPDRRCPSRCALAGSKHDEFQPEHSCRSKFHGDGSSNTLQHRWQRRERDSEARPVDDGHCQRQSSMCG